VQVCQLQKMHIMSRLFNLLYTFTDLDYFCSSSTANVATVLQPLCDRIFGDPLNIVVSRRAVLRSVQLAMCRPEFSFTRPAQIHFAGEDAIDDGGPRREFFRCVFCSCHLFLTLSGH